MNEVYDLILYSNNVDILDDLEYSQIRGINVPPDKELYTFDKTTNKYKVKFYNKNSMERLDEFKDELILLIKQYLTDEKRNILLQNKLKINKLISKVDSMVKNPRS